MILLDTPLIDSFSLAIDKNNIKILDHNFCSRILTYYYDTDEFGDELEKPKPLIHTYDGITLRFKWASLFNSEQVQRECLVITVSAKLLRERYFQGITCYNVEFVYMELMSRKVFYCSFEDFKKGLVSDLDVCINYRISQEAFIRTNQKIMGLARPGYNKFFNWFCEKKRSSGLITNLGLDINTRHKAKPSTPYLKHYYKTIELTTKSFEYYDKFLRQSLDEKGESIQNLARIEYTIKGSKHKTRLIKKKLFPAGISTLENYLNVPSTAYGKVIYSGFHDYINKPEYDVTERIISEMSPTDNILLDYQQLIIALGGTEDDLFTTMHRYTGVQKSRVKTKINGIYTHLKTHNLSVENQLEKNAEINAFFDRLDFS